MKSNSEIIEKLNDFIANPKDHAFLLCGPWGVGKTHIIFQEWLPTITEYKIIPISLFGISSLNDLNSLVMCKESFSNRLKNYLKKLNQNVGLGINHVSINIPLIGIVANALKTKHNKKEKYLFVIDDIERKDNKLSIAEVFGFVDSLPLGNTKVVLIANSNDLATKEDKKYFNGFKEKIVQREYNLEQPTIEAIKATIGDNYECLSLKKSIYPNNLRTLIRLKEIINKLNNKDIVLIKAIYICLLSICEKRLQKEEYLFNFEKHELRILYLLDDNSKERCKKETEEKLIDMRKEEKEIFDYLYENVKLLYLLDEIREDRLNAFLADVFKSVENGDYARLSNVDIPIREQPLERCPVDTSSIFYTSRPNSEYKRVMLDFEKVFLSKKYDLLDSFERLVATIINYKDDISSNCQGKAIEKRVLRKCKKPLAEYIVFRRGTDFSSINELFVSSDIPRWVIDLEKDILKECISLFNDAFVDKAKKDNFSFDCDYCLERANIINNLFRGEDFDKSGFALDDIFSIVAKNMIEVCSTTLDEINWDRCHHFARILHDYKNRYAFNNTIDCLEKTGLKNTLSGRRINILIKNHGLKKDLL